MVLQLSELRVEMEREEFWLLALYLKRLTWDDVRARAQCDAEATLMLVAVEKLQRGLAEIGVKPR